MLKKSGGFFIKVRSYHTAGSYKPKIAKLEFRETNFLKEAYLKSITFAKISLPQKHFTKIEFIGFMKCEQAHYSLTLSVND